MRPRDAARMSTKSRTVAEGRFIRTPAAAALLGCARQTLERWRWEGTGPPFVRLSRKLVVYDVADLEAWALARKVTSISEQTA